MIYNKYIESGFSDKVENFLDVVRKKISLKSIFFMLLSFAMSMQTLGDKSSLVVFSVFAIASLFETPLILVLVSSLVGVLFGGFSSQYMLIIIGFFTVFSLVTSFINVEGVSKKYAIFIKYIISTLIVVLVSNFIYSTLFSEFFNYIAQILISCIFYFVFVSGSYVLINLKKGYIYSKEESVSMIVILAFMMCVFQNVHILDYSVYNILVLALILIYGWKAGAVCGATSGLIIGLTLTLFTDNTMLFALSLAFSGCIAGFLRKTGKIGVILGFVVGNVYLNYFANGFSEVTIRLSEILIASIPLIFMPKFIDLKLSDIFNTNKNLDNPYQNTLDMSSSAKKKIGAVSEVFKALAEVTVKNTPEYSKETRQVIKRYILDYIDTNCFGCENQKSCIDNKALDITVDYISLKLEENEKIDKSMLSFECENADEIIKNISEIYNSMKLVRIIKEKEKENCIKVSNQYKEVSKILSNVANNLKENQIVSSKEQVKLKEELKFYGFIVYEDEYIKNGSDIEYTFVTDILTNIDKQKVQITKIVSDLLEQNMTIKLIFNSSKKEKSKIKLVSTPKYNVKTAVSSMQKTGELVCGDSYLCSELDDLKNISVISDGAGSGKEASKSSNMTISMLERLLDGGFNEKKAIDIVNSVIKITENSDMHSTLDICVVNLKNAEAEFVKIGSAPTYVLHENKVTTITSMNLPVGVVTDADYVPIAKKLEAGDIVVQVSDGVIKEGMDINKNYFTKHLPLIDNFKSTKIICDELMKVVLRENNNILSDDTTILVTKVEDNL